MANNLVKRLITGVLGSAFGVIMVVYNFYTFSALCLLLAFLLMTEFYTIMSEYKPLKWLGVASGMGMVLTASLMKLGYIREIYFVPFVMILSLVPIAALFDKNRNIIHTMSATYLGFIYITLPLILFVFMSGEPENYNRFLLLGMFLIIWSNDTGAYFAGKTLGKHKLFERVSPNKTIEGTIGGIILAFIIISILFYFYPSLSLIKWFILTLIVSIAGSLGDLVESQMKRTLKIKDSGSILPGHGGFLDRFDALIFALPFGYCCYVCFNLI